MIRTLKSTYITYCRIGQNISQNLMTSVLQIDDLEKLVTQIAIQIPMTLEQSQQFLECIDLKLQYDYLTTMLENQVEVYKIKGELRKIVWPGWKQTRNNSLVVVTVIAIFTVAVWLMDLIFENVILKGLLALVTGF